MTDGQLAKLAHPFGCAYRNLKESLNVGYCSILHIDDLLQRPHFVVDIIRLLLWRFCLLVSYFGGSSHPRYRD